MQLNPRAMRGSWDDGRTLDDHICRSEFIGYNEYGHPQFETTRTELGDLLYKLKYRGDLSAVPPIAEAVAASVREWSPPIDVIVPATPTRSRPVQPLFEIANEAGRLLDLPSDTTTVRRIKATPEVKNVDYATRLELLVGAHIIDGDALRGRRVLLLDDLFQTGATLNAIARLLKGVGRVAAVYARALTRARN